MSRSTRGWLRNRRARPGGRDYPVVERKAAGHGVGRGRNADWLPGYGRPQSPALRCADFRPAGPHVGVRPEIICRICTPVISTKTRPRESRPRRFAVMALSIASPRPGAGLVLAGSNKRKASLYARELLRARRCRRNADFPTPRRIHSPPADRGDDGAWHVPRSVFAIVQQFLENRAHRPQI